MGNTQQLSNITIQTYFANILLTADHPMGRMHAPKRKKGDWFHSISVFSDTDINNLPTGGRAIPCTVLHFFGHKGSPVLSTVGTTIRCYRVHMGKKLYTVGAWSDSVAVIGDVRTENGYESGHGRSTMSINEVITASEDKWGNDRIPYAHQRNEAYNCVAFVDDILSWAETQTWNKRIEAMHEKHGLYM
jgi:hypothetical protein